MAHNTVDIKTDEEEAVLGFYRSNSGANWVECAEALGMEEQEACFVSMRLLISMDLVEAPLKDGLVAFGVRGVKHE